MASHDKLADEIRSLMAAGRKIEAIQRYREATGEGLAEAKEAVEALERAEPRPGDVAAQAGLEEDVVALLREGRKIQAIKLYRKQMGVDLKGAKDAVEAIAAVRGIVTPRSGCAGVVLALILVLLVGVVVARPKGPAPAPDAPSAARSLTPADALALLRSKRFVDLTHAFAPGIPHWTGFPDQKVETIYWYEEGRGTLGKGFFAQQFTLVGQWGTHCDPPAHFVQGKRTIDQIDPKEMLLPLVVIDVHRQAARNPDYTITMGDVQAWQQRHGSIPAGAFVAMRTDWSKRFPDAKAMRNEDAQGVAHYPGWSKEVLQYLYEQRKVTASGHETTDTDPGVATSKGDYSLETYVLGTDHYQIELLANLDRVPEAGAIVVVAFPKPQGGSGFPARVFAIVP